MKKCCRCKTDKEESEFSPDNHHSDGLRSYCKQCVREMAKEPQSRNQPSRRKKWADNMFNGLNLDERDY